MPGVNESAGFAAASVPLSAAAVRDASAYSAPFSAAVYGVQNARLLLPGQPLPQNLAAFGLAVPAAQQQ
jgi:hypothetical protein